MARAIRWARYLHARALERRAHRAYRQNPIPPLFERWAILAAYRSETVAELMRPDREGGGKKERASA